MVDRNTRGSSTLISSRAYSAASLLAPNMRFVEMLNRSVDIAQKYVPILATEPNIASKLKLVLIKLFAEEYPYTCRDHNVFTIFIYIFSTFYIETWINNINKILNGSGFRNINDNIKKLALQRYDKYRQRKAAVRKVKQLT